ncbi:hypothetical protein [Allokutzneria albata]|uniref:Uncharacterized protein n=1 Tax=Allokutzneria albata TaxID=211114 RepID=A0A1G9ZS94_ALLAB|nr:hypothetical protein [Allokutzneria albata]SDN24482.1 hypothetical protein SAMN04489726_5693 [Allokutzneria albata]
MRLQQALRISVVAVVLGGAMSTGLAASASAAAEPIVVGDCKATVMGTPGQPVSLNPGAIAAPVVNLVRAVPLLGPPIAGEADKAIRRLPPIPIGAVPTGSGGYISGGHIASAVINKIDDIPLLGPVLGAILDGVRTTLTAGCGVTTQVVNAATKPVQEGTGAIADASQRLTGGGGSTPAPEQPPKPNPGQQPGQQPGPGQQSPPPQLQPGVTPGPGAGGLPDFQLPLWPPTGWYDFGRVPLYDYSNLPVALPGGLGALAPGLRYGQNVPGYDPVFGRLGGSADEDGVRSAGQASALPSGQSGRVAGPVLLAALALSCVTAALVRTWALRRLPA